MARRPRVEEKPYTGEREKIQGCRGNTQIKDFEAVFLYFYLNAQYRVPGPIE